jgi:hypothetical protein
MPVGESAVIGRPERIFAAVAVSGCVVLAGADLSVTGFHVLFTQDDPYIHLALAQRLLASGHYGLNEGEVAAPASSILYPFLLVPLLALGLGPAAALLINVLVAGVTGALLCGALREGGYNVDRMRGAALTFIAFGWMVGFNVFAVALTGMENLLAAALALAILLGLAALWRHDRLRWFLPVCAMLLPLVRYEGVGLWLICVLSLMLRRRFWAACVAFAPAALALGGFSLFLLQNGLPPLPSSVLSKASSGSFGSHSAAGNALAIVVNNMRGNFSGADAWPLLALIAGNLAVLCVPRLRRAPGGAPLALTGAAICLAHVLAGKFGGFGRYQAYAEIFGAMTVLLGFSGMLAPRIARGPAWAVALLAMAPVLLFPESILYALAPPLAAQNLYSQQYQLHRFITAFWRAPAGANDIGEVSYDNPYYLLDYAGLGSEAARLAHATATDPAWMNSLARGHGVEFAMLFPRWFPAVPANWRPVADLHLDMVNVIAGDPVVRFYAITPEAASRAAPLLQQFAAGLPPAAHLSIAGTKPEIKDVH